jgi:hypothetical protein
MDRNCDTRSLATALEPRCTILCVTGGWVRPNAKHPPSAAMQSALQRKRKRTQTPHHATHTTPQHHTHNTHHTTTHTTHPHTPHTPHTPQHTTHTTHTTPPTPHHTHQHHTTHTTRNRTRTREPRGTGRATVGTRHPESPTHAHTPPPRRPKGTPERRRLKRRRTRL